MSLNSIERTILSGAVEDTTWLIEFANGINEPPESSLASVGPDRSAMGKALLSLLNRQLTRMGTSRWDHPADASVTPIGEPELQARLADGSAWDPDRDDLIVMDATEAGRDLMIPPGEAIGGLP